MGVAVGDMKRQKVSPREHAGSRYCRVTEGLIDLLQQAYLQGRDLGPPLSHLDADTAAVIVAETLEADRIWNADPNQMLSKEFIGEEMSDFKRAALAEILFGVVDVSRETNDPDSEQQWWALALATLQHAAESPTASPLLWYEDLYIDLGEATCNAGDREALGWFKRALAHNLRYDQGSNAIALLLDLAETALRVGELNTGLRLLAALLRHDPAEIWIYNTMAFTLPDAGLTEVAVEAVRRGLQLLDQQGDPEDLRDQLTERLKELQTGDGQKQEAEVTPAVLAELRAALKLEFDAGQPRPLEALCRELVPDLDQVPVKRPMTPDDLLLPDRSEYLQALQPPGRRPGRNDPCWCGSGKKYKRCHMRSDRAT
jgi:tetratricopeptide (TPR) repeat protein